MVILLGPRGCLTSLKGVGARVRSHGIPLLGVKRLIVLIGRLLETLLCRALSRSFPFYFRINTVLLSVLKLL